MSTIAAPQLLLLTQGIASLGSWTQSSVRDAWTCRNQNESDLPGSDNASLMKLASIRD